jgi:hypothetical protein
MENVADSHELKADFWVLKCHFANKVWGLESKGARGKQEPKT